MNMQEPDDEMKAKIVADIKRKLTGSSNAGEVIVSFNSSKEYNTKVDRIEVSDAHSQYNWLCEFARDQICVSHKVISGGYWKIKCVNGCTISISGYYNKEGAIQAYIWYSAMYPANSPYAQKRMGD